jgi:ubiquinone/menaquinone biosynthesis C-methylase UbiE
MQDRLFEDPELVRFYDSENGWGDDTRFCAALAKDARSVLDLGCGTGLLATALAEGREVWGVDPASAMLDVARKRDGGIRVTWIEADARDVRLGRRFELVVMTGHAFQCLLTDDDQRALCKTIAAHLEPGGTFIFDSREPSREEWREWLPELSRRYIEDPQLGVIEAWNDVGYDPAAELVSYETWYRSNDGRTWSATSRIRFTTKDNIAARLAETGIKVDYWLGDWTGNPWTPSAKEIIAVGGLA